MTTPSRFLSLLTKNGVPELVAQTYAKAKNIDPNEANERLQVACTRVQFVQELQDEVWQAMLQQRPDTPDEEILARVVKRLAKKKRYQALKYGRKEDIELTAWALYVDLMAGHATGEAADLIASPEGSRLLAEGWKRVAAHFAKELLR